MKIKRRTFFGAAAAAAAGLGAAESRLWVLGQVAEAATARPRRPGPARYVPSLCTQCDGGCGVRAKVIDERVVNIEGNPLFPVNRGGVCPAGIAGIHAVYNPDRIRGPIRRRGERGSGEWEPIGWEEALGLIGQKLEEVRTKGPAGLVVLDGSPEGLMGQLLRRFCTAFGTPNYVVDRPAEEAVRRTAHYLLFGVRDEPGYDLEHSRYILSFGAPLLEAGRSPVRTMRAYAALREKGDARLVQVEPRLSPTAAKADLWVPLKPGSEGALALGIAYVIIKEGLYDGDFIRDHAFGFEDWVDAAGIRRRGFKSAVLEEYNLDYVSRKTDVPVSRIFSIATSFARTRPAVAIEGCALTNSLPDLLAIHALNALVGSIDVPGGVLAPQRPPVSVLEDPELDEVALKGLEQPRIDGARTAELPLAEDAPERIPQALKGEASHPVELLLLHYSNPLYSHRNAAGWRDVWAKIPFVASFSPYLDESAAASDLVLPDNVYFERWQEFSAPSGGRFAVFGLSAPVVEPLFGTRQAGEVVLEIARAMGGKVSEALPWENYPEFLKWASLGIFASRRGSIVEEGNGGISWTELLERRGWWYPSYDSPEELWKQLQEHGGWWDPVYYFGQWDRVFHTPSGRFEFDSTLLRQEVTTWAERRAAEWGGTVPAEARSIMRRLELSAVGDLAFQPHHEKAFVQEDEEEYPLEVIFYRPLALGRGRNANQPFLQEILAPHVHVDWDSWVEINPATARELEVANGGEVEIVTASGRVRTRARYFEGLSPGVLCMPLGLGHTAYGRWARGLGARALDLVAARVDPFTGAPGRSLVRAKLVRV